MSGKRRGSRVVPRTACPSATSARARAWPRPPQPTIRIRAMVPGIMPTTRLTRFAFVNAYLVPEDDGLTLIDTTLKGNGKNLLAAAERLRAPIVRIALTHGHMDPVAALDELAHA